MDTDTAAKKAVKEVQEVLDGKIFTKYPNLTEDDIKVTFRNKLVQVDVLDELEFLDTTVGMIRSVFEFFVENELMNKVTDKEKFLTWMDTKVSVLGLKNVIQISKHTKLTNLDALRASQKPIFDIAHPRNYEMKAKGFWRDLESPSLRACLECFRRYIRNTLP